MSVENNAGLVLLALQYYGTQAIKGGKNNPLVVGFFQKSGHSEIIDDETPWCSAFMNTIARWAGAPSTGSLAALSWLKVGTPVDSPQFGDVVIFDWSKVEGTGGHVGLVIAKFPEIVYVLGGNEDNEVQIKGYRLNAVAGFRRLF